MGERDEQAKALGAKYAIVVDDKVIYVKEPDKTIFKMFLSLYDQDPAGAKESTMRTLAIKEVSDMDLFEDYKCTLTIMSQLSEIMALKKSELKVL